MQCPRWEERKFPAWEVFAWVVSLVVSTSSDGQEDEDYAERGSVYF
jgi:hypothetical protein